MKRDKKPIGIYLHIPFCKSKCPYCDFYSLTGQTDEVLDQYVAALERDLAAWGKHLATPADTVYLGGGTPSLLGGTRIARLLDGVNRAFPLTGDAEITMEANPADDLYDTLRAFRAGGGNRVSLGMQSGNDRELLGLGRRHRADQTARAAEAVRKAGIDNLSFDLMLALAGQTAADIDQSIETCRTLGGTHVSAYMLKIEPNTPFGTCVPAGLPDDDGAADLYIHACEQLERAGYRQYEISNFAKDGQKSRHNLKYWEGADYLGIGAAAHSKIAGKRFAYPRDLSAVIRGAVPTEHDNDPPTDSMQEYAVLRLRLTDGIVEHEFKHRFGRSIPTAWRENADKIPAHLCVSDPTGIRLTRDGFLVSNAIMVRLITG